MKKKDWIEYFELVNGRKPSPKEYVIARNNGEFIEDDSDLAEMDEFSSLAEDVVAASPDYQGQSESTLSENVHVVDQRGQDIGFWRAIKDFFRGYFDFKGYTTRKGYWYVFLFNIVISSLWLYFFAFASLSSLELILYYPELLLEQFGLSILVYIFWLIPGVALAVRRFRDAGLRGWGIFWLYLLVLIPVINIAAVIFIFYALFQKSEHFIKDEETIFFCGKQQLEAYPNPNAPFRKSIGSGIGTSLLVLSVIVSLFNPYLANHSNQSESSGLYYSDDSDSMTIDLSDYEVSLYVNGKNGSGTAYAEVDYYPSVSSSDSDVTDFISNPDISLSKSSGLSNGDRVEVELTLDEDKAEELGLTLSGTYYEYFTVSQLKEETENNQAKDISNSESSSSSLPDYVVKSTNFDMRQFNIKEGQNMKIYVWDVDTDYNAPVYEEVLAAGRLNRVIPITLWVTDETPGKYKVEVDGKMVYESSYFYP